MVIDCCVIILTFLFPPVGVFLVSGIGADLCINICLTILGYLPGHIHAFYLLVKYAETPKQPQYHQVPASTPAQQQHYGSYQPYVNNQQPKSFGDNKNRYQQVGSSTATTGQQSYSQQPQKPSDAAYPQSPPPYKS